MIRTDMGPPRIFADTDALLENLGYIGVPVVPRKKVSVKGWPDLDKLSPSERGALRERYANYGIGLLLGTPAGPDDIVIAFDGDHNGFIGFIAAVIGGNPVSKFGLKGRTFICRAPKGTKSEKYKIKGADVHALEILGPRSQTVIPPTIHTSGVPYSFHGDALWEVRPENLVLVSTAKLRFLKMVLTNVNAWQIVEGGASIQAHEPMLKLAGCGIARLGLDLNWQAGVLESLLQPGYTGDTAAQITEMLQSAAKKELGAAPVSTEESDPHIYDPGSAGPIPLGYAAGEFFFRNQQTREVLRRSANQLMSPAGLFEMASYEFWLTAYPKVNKDGHVIGLDTMFACDGLIQACRTAGAIELSTIRGIGVWPEKHRLVVNLGGEIIESDQFVYSAPPKKLDLSGGKLDVPTILAFLSKPNWRTPSSPQLLLGWCVTAVITGALRWRPHVGLTGPAGSGKSTIIRGIAHILSPMAIVKEGLSTEAGLRQSLGFDARPIILDELEPEGPNDRTRISKIVKLMRSSSSPSGEVVRGTPEGKAVSFNVRASFLVGAINIMRISAADTSRILRLEMRPPINARRNHVEVLDLLKKLDGMGPAFCQMAINHAADVLASIGPLHSIMEVTQERHADNIATLLAGYWVAMHQRPMTAPEAERLVAEHTEIIAAQQIEFGQDDSTECLNALFGYAFQYEGGNESNKESVGRLVSKAIYRKDSAAETARSSLARFGVRVEGEGFVVANSHPGLSQVFRGTRWEGGLWGSALSRLAGAEQTAQKRFSDGVRSLAVSIPSDVVPPLDETKPSKF